MVKLVSSPFLGSDYLAVGAFRGSAGSFSIRFERTDRQGLEEILKRDAVAVRGASVEAVIETTREVKLAIRAYINAHFKGSAFTSNNNRRVANASAQEKFYDEVEGKGQYAGLVYSKFGKRDKGGFVDFLLLHVRGGPVSGKPWLRIVNEAEGGTARIAAQTGSYSLSQSDIFFLPSKDGKKLFQLRRYRKERDPKTGRLGRSRLLATLVKSITFPARLSGIDEIARRRPELFDRNFARALGARIEGAG